MNIILFDDDCWQNLLPLTYTKPVAALRVGISTIKEKWEHYSNSVSFLTKDYLSKKYKTNYSADNLYINGCLCPNDALVEEITTLEEGTILKNEEGNILAYRRSREINSLDANSIQVLNEKVTKAALFTIRNTWDLFSKNEAAIAWDFDKITAGKKSQQLNETNTVINNGKVFIAEGAKVNCAILNPDGGHIYIGKNAEIMEGSVIRGSLALCDNCVLKLATKIYGPTTVGPQSKVGGEVNNSVIQGFSNKGHDGFLGNSVIGEWCNLGADTNTSNLKNNYAHVRLWDYGTGRFADTGLQFCGLVMGDHSKCGINTMFNTGTVIGVSANIFGSGFPRNFIPSFSWGGSNGQSTYKLNKVFEVAEIVMSRRKIELDDTEKKILEHIFENTTQYRSWEK